MTTRQQINDALQVERHRVETRLLDTYLPAEARAAATVRLTAIIRELYREGRHAPPVPVAEVVAAIVADAPVVPPAKSKKTKP